MTPKEFLDIINKSVDFQELTYLNADNYYDHILSTKEFDTDYGASKLVFIPRDVKESNFVIKVPFNSADDSYYDDYEEEYYYNEFYYAEDVYGEYQGENWDYCGLEEFYYEKAKEAGVESFFAKTEFVGYIGNFPAYAQTYCDIGVDIMEDEVHEQYANQLDHYDYLPRNINWALKALQKNGINKLAKLNRFLEHWDISDLRDTNVGQDWNGNIVITDYSAYND